MAEHNVRHIPELPALALPEYVTIAGQPDIRMTPNQMRALRAETGRTIEELMGDDADDADRLQTVIWLELRRGGSNARWDEVGDVGVDIQPAPLDPTSTDGSPSLPDSAVTGE